MSDTIYRQNIGKGGKAVKTYRVQIAEKISREYEVIGAASMADAVRLVKEQGGHFYHNDGIQSNEVDGSWDFHHEYAPKAVRTITSAPCVMYGKWFTKPLPSSRQPPHRPHARFNASYHCDSVVEGSVVQLCRKCEAKINDGYTIIQEEASE